MCLYVKSKITRDIIQPLFNLSVTIWKSNILSHPAWTLSFPVTFTPLYFSRYKLYIDEYIFLLYVSPLSYVSSLGGKNSCVFVHFVCPQHLKEYLAHGREHNIIFVEWMNESNTCTILIFLLTFINNIVKYVKKK